MDNQQPKEDLRLKLQQAMKAKRSSRRKQKTVEELNKRVHLERLDENQNLMAQVELLMAELETPKYKKMSLLNKAIELKDKYPFLSKKYPPIFRSVLHGEMNMGLLQMMLNHRSKITSGETTEEDASKQMANFLYNKFAKKE